MGRTPDAYDGPRIDEAVIWEEQTGDPDEARMLQYVQDKGLVILEDGVVRAVGEGRANIWQFAVDNRAVDTPPGSLSAGYRVIVGSSPTGDFASHAGEIAQWNGSAWVFTSPMQGMVAYVRDEDELYKQTSATSPWVWGKVAGAGINADQHRVLRQLIHFISEGPSEGFASGAYKETLPSGAVFPTSIIWWESSSKSKKLVERTLTWTGVVVTTDLWEIYDTDGSTAVASVSDAISYTSNIFETTRTRTITVS